MKGSIIIIVSFIIVAAYIGHLEINISPFYVRLTMWHRVVCMLLIVIAYFLWNFGERQDAYSKGLQKGMEITLQQIRERYGK